MRVQEHIYQGFFGLKKKKDADKLYKDHLTMLKGIDKDIDEVIKGFEHVLNNHNLKLKRYTDFLNRPSKDTLKAVRIEIEKLEGMYDEDELANDKEQKFTLKGIESLKDLIKEEDADDLNQLEKDNLADLNELYRLLKAIEPLWQEQIDFMKKSDDEILSTENIRRLSDIMKREGEVLKMEETLLRRIDVKTGSIIRKTELKEQSIENTKEMGMEYREIRRIK